MTRDPRLPPPGTVLVAECKGRRLEVRVLDDGFEWEGARWRSLSAIASRAYSCPANGYVLFGLRPKPQRTPVAEAVPLPPSPPPRRKAGRPIAPRRN